MGYNSKLGGYIIIYLWFTYLIYILSPLHPVDKGLNEIYTIVFLSAVSIAVYIGCKSVSIPKLPDIVHKCKVMFSPLSMSILQAFIILVTCGYLADLFARGLGGFTLAFGENYEKMLESTGKQMEVSFWGQIYALISPIRYILLAYGAYYFKTLDKPNKYLYIGIIVTSFCYSVFGLGTQKGVGDIVIVVVVALWLKAQNTNRLKSFKKNVIIISLLFISFFSYMSISRLEAKGGNVSSSSTYYEYDKDNIVSNIFGEKIGRSIVGFGSYISNGYPGLNYCLQMDFEWTCGYGNSRAANDYLSRYIGAESEFNNTYPLRMEKEVGWPGLMFWPTAFSWWASDITWFGVIILMGFFSRFMCLLFKESYYYHNPLSICVFAYFCIGLIYLPANNQLMQSTANFITTVSLLCYWLMRHKKYNYD